MLCSYRLIFVKVPCIDSTLNKALLPSSPQLLLMLLLYSYHIHAGCDRRIDCVFMLDRSGSVGRENHGIAIQFIRNVVSFFNIGLNATRVGLVAYSTSAHVEFFLNNHTTLPQLQEAISQVAYTRGRTSTALALNVTRIILNSSRPFGARPSSDGIPKIGILITGEW